MSAERDPQAPEIRAWGAENGWDVPERGRIPAALRSAWATANAGGPVRAAGNGAHTPSDVAALVNGSGDSGGAITFSVPDYIPPEELPPPNGNGYAEEEQPPGGGRRSRREALAERFRNRRQALPGRRRRVTLETLGGLVWAGAAQLCARNGRFLPVASIMAYQAPVAGMVVEDSLKNTVADAVLQPVARLVESGSTLGSLLGPPALVGLVCARPEAYPLARPLLEIAMKEWVITAGPKLRQLKAREEKFAAEMAAMAGEDGEEGEFDINAILDEIFKPLFEAAAAAQAQAQGQAAPASGGQ